jgi:hypothetical protein
MDGSPSRKMRQGVAGGANTKAEQLCLFNTLSKSPQ